MSKRVQVPGRSARGWPKSRLMRALPALLAAFGFACGVPPPEAARAAGSELSPLAARLVEERRLPGMSIAILEGDRLAASGVAGFARIDPSTPVTRDTIFDLASITKSFTAAAAMTLVERGEIGLEDPAVRWLPELAAGGASPRVRELLSQTAGLPELFSLPGYPRLVAHPEEGPAPAAEVAEIGRAPRVFAPGRSWAYSNSNYAAVALLVERQAGEPYARFLAERVLAPLGLSDIGPCPPINSPAPGFAALYRVDDGGRFVPADLDAERHTYVGYGDLCGTAEQLARFFRALANGRIVSAASFRRMTAPAPLELGGEAPYGFGLSLLPIVGREAFAHTGSSGTAAAYFPASETTIVVLTNRDLSFAEDSLQQVARSYWKLPPPPPLDVSPPTPFEIGRFTGRFEDGLFRFEVTLRDGALWLDNPPFGAPRRLARERAGRFVSVAEPGGIALELPHAARHRGVDLLFDWAAVRSFARRDEEAPPQR